MLVLVNQLEKIWKPRTLPGKSPWRLCVQLWYPSQRKLKSNNWNKRLKVLASEIFKTINNLNPNYMKDIFTLKLHAKIRSNDILAKYHITITYGTKGMKIFGPKKWKQLLGNIKLETFYIKFKEYIETWSIYWKIHLNLDEMCAKMFSERIEEFQWNFQKKCSLCWY